MTNEILKAFGEKFKIQETSIKDYRHWTWSLRPVQCTLGAGIISLKRFAAAFSEISTDEAAELAVVARDIEKSLRKVFRFDKINYLLLMMVDPHVHFHVVPRYATKRSFAGVGWVDTTWPKLPDLGSQETPADTRRAIIDAIKGQL